MTRIVKEGERSEQRQGKWTEEECMYDTLLTATTKMKKKTGSKILYLDYAVCMI